MFDHPTPLKSLQYHRYISIAAILLPSISLRVIVSNDVRCRINFAGHRACGSCPRFRQCDIILSD